MTATPYPPAGAVLFDFDGTLADSRARLLHCWHQATTAVLGRHFPSTPAEERAIWTLNGWGALELVHEDPTVRAEVSKRYAAAYTDPSGPEVGLYPGIREALDELRVAGFLIAVVTAKARARFEQDLCNLNLDGRIDATICAEDVTAHKPDPAGALAALGRLGVSPWRAVMVGDSPQDMAAGLAADVSVVGAGWGFIDAPDLEAAGAQVVARTPDELPGLVAELLGATTSERRAVT